MASQHAPGIASISFAFLTLFLIFCLSPSAFADPVIVDGNFLFNFTADFDTPLAFKGTIDSPIPINANRVVTNLLLPGLTNWEVILSLVLNDRSPLGVPDIVTVSGRAKHINDNPDDGQHTPADTFEFSATFSGGPPPGIALIPAAGGSGIIFHIPHFDLYSLNADLTLAPGDRNDIAAYSLQIEGMHISPEPNSLLLWGTAMAGVGLALWRRRRQN